MIGIRKVVLSGLSAYFLCVPVKAQEVKSPITLIAGECPTVKVGDQLLVSVIRHGWLPSVVRFVDPNSKTAELPIFETGILDRHHNAEQKPDVQIYRVKLENFANPGSYRFDYEKRVVVGGGGKRPGVEKNFPKDAAKQLQQYCFTILK